MTYRIYNNQLRPVGTMKLGQNYNVTSLSFGAKDSEIAQEFRKNLFKFLEEKELKLVKSENSMRRHHQNKQLKESTLKEYYIISRKGKRKILIKITKGKKEE